MHPSKPYSVHLTQSADVFVVVVGMLGFFWGGVFLFVFLLGDGCCCFVCLLLLFPNPKRFCRKCLFGE